jgi:phage terminase large subunit-like protein
VPSPPPAAPRRSAASRVKRSVAPESRYVRIANKYAADVIAGNILACKWVRLACQRHLNDLEASKSKTYLYRFDNYLASLPCEFIECLPHTEGEWATPRGKRSNLIRLEAWQIFCVCIIFGWVRKTTGRRRFREAYIKIPRKNGKSILASVLALYMLVLDGENAPQVYSGATTERQAMEVFKPASRILESTDQGKDLKREFGLEAHAKRILCRFNGGSFVVLVRKPGDGAGASFAVIDERHEHKTDDLHDTLKKGQRARLQPLIFNITTAGVLIDGPCHQFEQFCERILAGDIDNDATFAIMFGIDTDPVDHEFTSHDAIEELVRTCNCNSATLPAIAVAARKQKAVSGELILAAYAAHTERCDTQHGHVEAGAYRINRPDDWRTKEALIKANPNYGISIYPEVVLQELQDAIQDPAQQNGYRTKTLNEWMNVGVGLFNMAAWSACYDPTIKIEDFAGKTVDEGDDLARKIDLASRCKVFTEMRINPASGLGERHYFVFGTHYVPKALANDGEHQHYLKWINSGHLVAHDGWEIQLPWIQQDIEEDFKLYEYRSLAFDPWNAIHMQQLLVGKIPEDVVQDAPQDLKILSGIVKEVQAAILGHRIHHIGDPVLTFCMSCVVGYEDNRGNIFPKKVRNGRNKIDAASAMFNAIGRSMLLQPDSFISPVVRGI